MLSKHSNKGKKNLLMLSPTPRALHIVQYMHHMRHTVLQKFHLLSTPSGHEWNPYRAAQSKTIKESEAGTAKRNPSVYVKTTVARMGPYLLSQNEEKKKLLKHIAC